MTGETPEVHEALAVYAPETTETERVPDGYKLSEVGVIPEDWEVERLGQCLARSPEYGINAPAVDYVDSLPTYIRITDITDEGRFSPEKLVSVDHENSGKYFLEQYDLVFARTGASVGKSYLYDEHDGALVFAGFLIRVRPDRNKLIPGYLANYVLTSHYWTWIGMMSARSGQPGVNGKEYAQLPIPIPPLHEQRAIAAALSDVDALISALDKLIAKKRAVKVAAMQQLLTGKQRLPGFSGEWEVKRLGDLGKTYGGITGKTKADFGQGEAKYIPFLNVMNNVEIDVGDFASVAISESEAQNSAKKNDLFFNGSSETPEELGMCSALLDGVEDVYLNSFCFGFRVNSETEIHSLYLAYFFRSGEGRKLLYSLAQGATRYNLSKVNFLKLDIPLPDQEEQTAIAAVLSDMDAEVEALESRREKTRQVKQGMMQEVLTGKTRLVPTPIEESQPVKQMQTEKAGHNWAFNEAVVIAALAERFATNQYPIGRMRYTKLAYLLHRHTDGETEGYLKKPAGPYNPGTRYKGAESIAQKNRYISSIQSGKFSDFVPDQKIDQALAYFAKWYGEDTLEWLEQYRYEKNDSLEALTTVAMAMQELRQTNREITAAAMEGILQESNDWRPKLKKQAFSRTNIQRAISRCRELFGEE